MFTRRYVPTGRTLRGLVAAAAVGLAADAALAGFTAIVNGPTLLIEGDDVSDGLAIRLEPGIPQVLQVDVGDDGTADYSFDRDEFSQIVVHAGGGDDLVRIDESNGVFTDTEITTLNGDEGDDTLLGGVGNERLNGGLGDDLVDGNRGSDIVTLGEGNDLFHWDPGDGSDVIEGGAGRDTLVFNGSAADEIVDLSANGTRLRFSRNIGNIVMDVDGVEQVDFQALGGSDSIVINDLVATKVRAINLDLAGTLNGSAGDEVADLVTYNGTVTSDQIDVTTTDGALVTRHRLPAKPAGLGLGLAIVVKVLNADPIADRLLLSGTEIDHVNVNGTMEADTLSLTANGQTVLASSDTFPSLVELSGITSVAVNGKSGDDTIACTGNLAGLGMLLRLDGGQGDDIVLGSNGGDELYGGPGNDLVDGQQGNDTVFLATGDDVFEWDPGDGSDTVEGGWGTDVMEFNGSNAAEIFDIAADGSRVRFLRNIASIVMDLDGIEQIELRALGGADIVEVNDLTGTVLTHLDVNLAGTLGGNTGDVQVDSVSINGTAAADTWNISADGPAVAAVLNGSPFVTRVFGFEAGDNVAVEAVTGELVNINGSDGPDTFSVVANGTQSRVDSADFSTGVAIIGTPTLSMNGLGGHDTMSCTGNLAGIGLSIVLDGGDGDDTLLGSNGADLLIGGDGNDILDGQQGNDAAFLGAGDDTFQWDPGDGSDTVEGQDGHDTLAFNGSGANEIIDLSANGSRLRFFRNIASIVMDLDGVEQVDFRALGGADIVEVNDLAATDTTQVNVHLAGTIGGSTGDTLADSVLINGTAAADTWDFSADGSAVAAVLNGSPVVTRVFGVEPGDTVVAEAVAGERIEVNGSDGPDTFSIVANGTQTRVDSPSFSAGVAIVGTPTLFANGLGGDDTISCTGNLAGIGIPIVLDGGGDDDTLLASNGADLLLGGDGNDLLDGQQGNDTAFFGAGDDVFQWDPGDGSDIVEGQDGHDTLAFNGSGASEIFDASPNGERLRFTRNVASIVMDVSGVEQFDLRALGGADLLTIHDLSATAVAFFNVDLAGTFGGSAGDAQTDTVTVNGTNAPDVFDVFTDSGTVVVDGPATLVRIDHPEAPLDRLIVNGLGGVDSITVDPDVQTLLNVTVNQD